MTAASVYYGPPSEGPRFVVIDGEYAPVSTDADPVMGGDWRLRAVDAACRTLGYRTIPGAPIVREANGHGTVRVEPVPSAPAPAPAPETPGGTGPLDNATAYITTTGGGVPHHVAVDGACAGVATLASLTSRLDSQRDRAIAAVATALRTLGYTPTSTPTIISAGTWMCQATLTTTDTPHDDGDWHDQPTLVRITDTAATQLTAAADALGIPADDLATAWIHDSARSALAMHAWLTRDPANPVDVTHGWTPAGTPAQEGTRQ